MELEILIYKIKHKLRIMRQKKRVQKSFFDRWIEKQYKKRFGDPMESHFQPCLTITKLEPLKYKNVLMVSKEVDEIVDIETKKTEIAKKFLPVIAENMQFARREGIHDQIILYEAMIEIIRPKEAEL